MAAQSISLSSYVKLLRGNANFRRLWIAQIISEVGDWFYMVALYAMLLEFTGRAELLGIFDVGATADHYLAAIGSA